MFSEEFESVLKRSLLHHIITSSTFITSSISLHNDILIMYHVVVLENIDVLIYRNISKYYIDIGFISKLNINMQIFFLNTIYRIVVSCIVLYYQILAHTHT